MSVKGYRFVSPGIFLREVDQSVLNPTRPERGPVIIGRFNSGPAMRPVTVTSYTEFKRIFGAPHPGGSATDSWRGEPHGGPTYGGYAVEAWLDSGVAPATVMRLLGEQNSNTTTAGKAGWDTKNSAGTSRTHVASALNNTTAYTTNGGAYGLFIVPSGSGDGTTSDTPSGTPAALNYTGSLAAVWYLTEGAMYLKGPALNPTAGSEVSGAAGVVRSRNNSGGLADQANTYTAVIVDSSGVATEHVFDFTPGSGKHIRESGVFNMDPGNTNGTTMASAERAAYWLGETYEASVEEHVTATSSSAGHQLGIILGLGNSNAEWQQHRESYADGKTGWYIAQDTGVATAYDANLAQKLFRFVGRGHGEWIQNNLRVSIENIAESNNSKYRYGTFDVVIRYIDAPENSAALETFSKCNLDPNSPSFVGKKVGDRYVQWDATNTRVREYGAYDNLSEYIRIEMKESVKRGSLSPELLPFGVHGPVRFKGFSLISATSGILSLNTAATATITITAYTELNSSDKVNLVAADGTNYDFVNGSQSSVNGTWESATSNDQTATNLMNVINTSSGPAGTRFTATVDGAVVTVTQATLGVPGNTTITLTDTGTAGMTKTDFTGALGTGTTAAFANAFVEGSGSIPNMMIDTNGYAADALSSTLGDVPNADGYEVALGNTTSRHSYNFPAPRLVKTANVSGETSHHKQLGAEWSKRTNDYDTPSGIFDPSVLEPLRRLPAYYAALESAPYDNDMEYSWIFTLDDVQLSYDAENNTESAKAHYVSGSRQKAAYVDGDAPATARPDLSSKGRSWTAASGAFNSSNTGLLDPDLGYNSFTTFFHGGFDGMDIQEREPFRNTYLDDASADRTANYGYNTVYRAIDTLADPEYVEFNIMSMPGLTENNLTKKMVEVCETRADALAVIDVDGGFQPWTESNAAETSRRGTVNAIASNMKSRELDSSYGCAYYPWVQVRDNRTGDRIWMPPSVVGVGVMGGSQAKSEVWFAPAGFVRGGLTSQGMEAGAAGLKILNVKERLTSLDRDKLYEQSVNPIAKFPSEGLVVFGQKTLQLTPSALDRINVRRLMLYVKKEISIIASTTIFGQNVQTTWDSFKSRCDTFLADVQTRFGLTDFLVKLDETTTTDDLIDRNIMYAQIYLKPARAIEFIAIDFIITKSGASFED